uniref:Rab-GAP TBC domain-containing protein n=1 Tax=Mesocestoides corti TaxID=53468 RepID=A0A5K3EZZ7_MESCO
MLLDSSRYVDLSEKYRSEKVCYILKHLNDGHDLQSLRVWSISRYGLVNDEVRRKVWPVLVGIKSSFNKNEYDLADLLSHPQAKQIELDVRRMGSMIPEGTSTEESERLITETKRLALSILTEYPELHYYQGFHDICFTCLAVLGPDDAFAVLRQIVPKHFSSFMQKTMNATSEMLQLVFDLLKLTSPEIWSRFQALNFEPFFALSWFLTWFTHILSDSNDVHRLYDLFLASDPTMLIYLSVSVIICSTEEISSTSDDFGELHRALTHLPMKHEVERLIQCALDIYQTVGPEKLLQGADERRLGGQASSRSPSPFLLNAINQRLLVCGAVAVVTVGFVWRRFFYSSV